MFHGEFTSHERPPTRWKRGRKRKVLSPRGISLSSVHTLCHPADFAFDTVSLCRHTGAVVVVVHGLKACDFTCQIQESAPPSSQTRARANTHTGLLLLPPLSAERIVTRLCATRVTCHRCQQPAQIERVKQSKPSPQLAWPFSLLVGETSPRR